MSEKCWIGDRKGSGGGQIGVSGRGWDRSQTGIRWVTDRGVREVLDRRKEERRVVKERRYRGGAGE